jgi:hypothetical protein
VKNAGRTGGVLEVFCGSSFSFPILLRC